MKKITQTLWWSWRTSSTIINEDHGVELPGPRQPPGNSGASGTPEVRGGGYSLLVRDKNGREEDVVVSMGFGFVKHGGERL